MMSVRRFQHHQLKHAETLVVLALIIFLLLIVLAAFVGGAVDMWRAVKLMTVWDLLALTAIAVGANVLRGWRWWLLLADQRVKDVPHGRLVLYYTAGYALVPTPGKIGTTLRLWFLKKNHGVRYAKSGPVLVLDQMSDFVAMVLLAVLCSGAVSGYGPAVALVVLSLLALVGALILPRFSIRLIKLNCRLCGGRLKRLFATLIRLIKRVRRLFGRRVMLSCTLVSLCSWALMGAGLWLLVQVMGFELSLAAAIFIFNLATLLGGMTMVPGGLGGAEATMAGLLIAMGIPPAPAMVATLVIRFFALWLSVLVGFATLPAAMRTVRS